MKRRPPLLLVMSSLLAGAVFACAAGGRGGNGEIEESAHERRIAGPALPGPVIGVVLPVSGSPSNREYPRLFMEGVEIAADLARRAGLDVELLVEDNRGTASGTVRGVSALVSRGAVAILGPLAADNVGVAVRNAPGSVPFFSPTARYLPVGRRGVYSLGAGDPGAGLALAEAVADLGYRDAVVIHPRSAGERLEAVAFQEAFAAGGGVVRRRIPYQPGITTFEEPLTEVMLLAPSLLVIMAPPGDVELLAPQIAFFGLDELGVQVAGTAAWTTPSVIEAVARRHTDGVVAVSTVPPGAVREPPAEFVDEYERRFRRSLHSTIPAAGFDLLRMAVGAYGQAARTSGDMITALERLHRFEGVTGTYSFSGGRLTREFHPVRIFDGNLYPADADWISIPPPGHPAAR
ncbi:MAG: ABC transporter substrate-binding protein [Gemmatimonadetes bacterium]|nr:ABC transporter substrate-binding protein [Gemmatimonadota bacterium]